MKLIRFPSILPSKMLRVSPRYEAVPDNSVPTTSKLKVSAWVDWSQYLTVAFHLPATSMGPWLGYFDLSASAGLAGIDATDLLAGAICLWEAKSGFARAVG